MAIWIKGDDEIYHNTDHFSELKRIDDCEFRLNHFTDDFKNRGVTFRFDSKEETDRNFNKIIQEK